MRPSAISADVLFEAFRNSSLRWQWIAGLGASERRFDEMAVRSARSGADLVGYLNYIHPYRLQVLGEREIAYLTNATSQDCLRRIARIVTLEPPVLVLADGQDAPFRAKVIAAISLILWIGVIIGGRMIPYTDNL